MLLFFNRATLSDLFMNSIHLLVVSVDYLPIKSFHSQTRTICILPFILMSFISFSFLLALTKTIKTVFNKNSDNRQLSILVSLVKMLPVY